jgi:iron complex outermembrane receptor protein
MRRGQHVGTLALSLSLAVGSALWTAPARAQTSQASQPGQGGQPSAADVVVTAERRAEKVQQVPITLTVIPPQQLNRQNIQTTTDLVRAVPSLTVSDEGVFQIRSLGTEGFGRSAEQSVSVVLDGVVLGRALTNAMYDLDHVEVLSGPQGTLFGKNATAGVINVVTNAPVLGQYQAIAHADLGNHAYVHSYVIGNVPLGDDAALRLSYHHDSTGDIVYNTLYHDWDYSTDDGVRARLLWRPTSKLTINLSADYQKLASNGVNGVADFAGVAVYTYAPPGSGLQQTLAACGIVASPTNNRVCANSLHAPGVNVGATYGRWNAGGSLQIDYDLPLGLTFTSITALRQTVNEDFGVHANLSGEFGDTLPENILDRNLVPYFDRTWSEEARIASPASDPVNFVAGFYYAHTDTHDEIDQTGQFGLALGPLQYRRLINIYINQQNYAGFGQVNWQATSNLKLFAGGRVTHDDLSDISFNAFPDAYPAGDYIYTGDTGFFSVLPVNSCTLAGGVPYDTIQKPCPAGTSVNSPGRLSTTGLSGTIGAQYQFDRRLMVFATLSHGYKGPFINEAATYVATLPQTPLLVKPEYPTDVEVGVKATIHRFALDGSFFYDHVQNFQTTIYVPPGPGQAVANFIQGNAPYVTSMGIEASLFGDLTDNLSVNAGAIYNDASFNKGFLVNCATGPCPALHQLPFAPRFKATLSGDYHRPIAGGPVVGFIQSDLAYSDSYPYASAPGYPGSPPRYLLGARAGVRSDHGKWSIAVFCRNCLDKRYPISAAPDGYAAYDGGIVGARSSTYQFLTIDSYRVVGVTLDGRF